MKEIVSQKKWVYTLYRTEDGLLLSVVCGGVAMFEVEVLLSKEEAFQVQRDEGFLDLLAEKIRNNPKQYMQ
ncbi:hypothetical protein O5O45_08650 [Hahella aquimaris]|uniref:hypothetical protein n=1 Tax=Hahella sp. HNIBRBA332 TaxID=3015983 RepID=UPI00273BFB4E|nr:hypothetical protein [Hahella sp. HNIBRBA332]WLQ15981.1 hypothetical protein O5O45_08650 [Hahella sp. HNIBRBA332]